MSPFFDSGGSKRPSPRSAHAPMPEVGGRDWLSASRYHASARSSRTSPNGRLPRDELTDTRDGKRWWRSLLSGSARAPRDCGQTCSALMSSAIAWVDSSPGPSVTQKLE